MTQPISACFTSYTTLNFIYNGQFGNKHVVPTIQELVGFCVVKSVNKFYVSTNKIGCIINHEGCKKCVLIFWFYRMPTLTITLTILLKLFLIITAMAKWQKISQFISIITRLMHSINGVKKKEHCTM